MERHLTERELIEYRFGLASDERVAGADEHLARCAECRAELERLDRKFASLDLLREDVHASEELIAQVLEQAKEPATTKVVPFVKYPWLGAVAAVLLIGVVIFFGNLTQNKQKQQEFVKDTLSQRGALRDELRAPAAAEPGAEVPLVAKESGEREQTPPMGRLAPADVRRDTYAMDAAKPQAPVMQVSSRMLNVGAAASEPIAEQPPFAPASAIELVTLPRRDSVQLTIYNSTFQTLKMSGGYGGYGGALGGLGGGYGGYGAKLDGATRKAIEGPVEREQQRQIPSSAAGGDLTLVRERRNLTLKKGWNWLQFMWANTLIDPTSLSLEPLEQADKIDIQQLVFPARLRELGRWLIRSEISGQVPFEITYFTSGLSWRAFYMGTLSRDEKTMKLDGYVRVANNSGEDYENAQTRLIVGQVHLLDQIAQLAKRQYPYDRPALGIEYDADVSSLEGAAQITNGAVRFSGGGYGGGMMAGMGLKEIVKEGLSEYFLYTIEGAETIPNQWGKRLLSFEAEDIKVESLYKYDEERWSNQTMRFVKFANDEEHNLGETPIPNGNVKIYGLADEQGYLSYVGGAEVKYIPVNEEVELNLGPAKLVQVEPKLMDFKTENYAFDNEGDISGWDEIRTWRIELTNTRTLPIEIEITRGFETAYWTLALGQKRASYEKYDATHARFRTILEPREKWSFEYTVRTYHGTREQAYPKGQ